MVTDQQIISSWKGEIDNASPSKLVLIICFHTLHTQMMVHFFENTENSFRSD